MCDIVSFMNYIILCCPEGTYVKEGERTLSFKRERDGRCPSMLVAPTDGVEDKKYVVGCVILIVSLMLWCYVSYKMYAMCRQRRQASQNKEAKKVS